MPEEKNKTYADEIWYQKFRRIHTFKRSRTKDNSPKVVIDFNNQKVLINHKLEKLDSVQKNKLIAKLNKKLNRIENLKQRIEGEEKDVKIKDFYLNKLEEEKISVTISLLRLSDSPKHPEIFENLKKIYPLPSRKEFDKFLNEFIFFLHQLLESKKVSEKAKILILEILKDKFFNHKYKNPKIKNWKFEILEDKKLYKILNFEEIFDLINKTLKDLKIEKIVKLRVENRSIFSVSIFNKRLNIPKNIKLTYKRILEIIEHEIKVHLIRGINGSNFVDENGQYLHMLEINTKEELVIEEGLATYFEQNVFRKSNKYDLTQLYQYYVRLLATFLATKNQPFALYLKLVKLFELQKELFPLENINPKEAAEILIQRLYSDFPSPKVGYFNPRISIYLIGNRKVWEMIESGQEVKKLLESKSIIDLN